MSIEKYTAYTGMLRFYGVYKHHGIPSINCVVGDVAPAVNTCKAVHTFLLNRSSWYLHIYLNNVIFTFTDETYSLRPDHCCFSSETNSTTTSCNVSVSGLNTSTVGGQRLPLELEPTDHNLVCNENVLSLTVEVSDGE